MKQRFYYFINWKLIDPKPEVKQREYHLDALCGLQYHHGTDVRAVFTVLDTHNERAFSQEYEKRPEGMCWHSQMWKHLPGQTNPDSPSYSDLMKLI